jgi:hypothetical protein
MADRFTNHGVNFSGANNVTINSPVAGGPNAQVNIHPAQDPRASDRLIPMVEIDSFARAQHVYPSVVASFANPLDLLEQTVKLLIARILGEPYVPKDWGGETDDLFTPRVTLKGRSASASFALKGPGAAKTLHPNQLDKRGDQVDRMLAQPADLYVVAHTGSVSTSIRRQLNDGITARHGHRRALGSIWDGSDLARLFIAHDFLDPDTGILRPGITPTGR